MAERAPFDSSVHFSMATVAGVLGWSTDRTRQWFCRQGIAVKVGGRWTVTPDALRANFPAVADRITEALDAARGNAMGAHRPT